MTLNRTLTTQIQGLLILIAIGLLAGCYDNNSPNTSGTRSTGIVLLPTADDTSEDPTDIAQDDSSDASLG